MNKREQEMHNAFTDVSGMDKVEDKRCGQVAELFRSFLDSLGDACIVRSEQFGYIVLAYFVDGRFEDNDVLIMRRIYSTFLWTNGISADSAIRQRRMAWRNLRIMRTV